MGDDVRAYRECVIDALNRMASVEAELSRAADAREDEERGAMHEHGEACLREAAEAIKGIPCE